MLIILCSLAHIMNKSIFFIHNIYDKNIIFNQDRLCNFISFDEFYTQLVKRCFLKNVTAQLIKI